MTPEEIALGLRAAKVVQLAPGLVVWDPSAEGLSDRYRHVVLDINADYVRTAALAPTPCLTLRVAIGCPLIPDITSPGFVSTALAQVRARAGDAAAAMARRLVCDDRGARIVWDVVDRLLNTISRGDTEAEAVVAALEVTR